MKAGRVLRSLNLLIMLEAVWIEIVFEHRVDWQISDSTDQDTDVGRE